MSAAIRPAQRLEPQRRALDRPGMRFGLGQDRDRPTLDHERERPIRRRARGGRPGRTPPARPDWPRARLKTAVTISRTSPREHVLDVGVEQQHHEKDAADDRHARAAASACASATNCTTTSGQLAAAMSAPRLRAAFSAGAVGSSTLSLVYPLRYSAARRVLCPSRAIPHPADRGRTPASELQ